MIRRPPRSTQSRSSAASDVYKRQDNRKMFRCQSAAWSLGRSGGDLVELVMQGRTFCGRCATTGRTPLVGCHGEIGIDRGPPLRARLPSSPVDKRERWGCPYEVMVVVFRACLLYT